MCSNLDNRFLHLPSQSVLQDTYKKHPAVLELWHWVLADTGGYNCHCQQNRDGKLRGIGNTNKQETLDGTETNG